MASNWDWSPFGSGWLEPLLAPAWLGPDAKMPIVHAASMVLCVPFFLVSVWIEQRLAWRWERGLSVGLIKRWAWRANSATYALIVLGLAAAFVVSFLAAGSEASR